MLVSLFLHPWAGEVCAETWGGRGIQAGSLGALLVSNLSLGPYQCVSVPLDATASVPRRVGSAGNTVWGVGGSEHHFVSQKHLWFGLW